VRRRRHRLYFTHLCLWHRLRGEFLPKALPLRQNELVTFILCCPFQDCGDRECQSTSSASSCVDTEEYVDEIGNTCDSNVSDDCTDKNKYINKYGFTPEGWKDLLRNCPVSCNLCDSKASRRHLEDDLSSDPCVCMPAWSMSMSKVEPTCENQQGCPASACDNDTIGPWCLVVNPGCVTAEGDGRWAYCSPGTTVVPTEFYRIIYLSDVPYTRLMIRGQNTRLMIRAFHELISHSISLIRHFFLYTVAVKRHGQWHIPRFLCG
jgi:hypothetical protein